MSNDDDKQKPGITVSPGRCLFGATIAGTLAYALYWLTANIAGTFAAKPVVSSNVFTMNIAIAVRTLVVGGATLATFIFALAAVGLVALGIQIWFHAESQSRREEGNE